MKYTCDGSYEEHLKAYNEHILRKYGVSSQSAEREIIWMSDSGNTVARKLYADMVFYQKILRKNYYRDAFSLYMQSAGITIYEDGKWQSNGRAYPVSFWMLGYYLVNYRRESFLQKCETIDAIEMMTFEERLGCALELAVSCLDYEEVPGAVNLIGRILREISEDEELFERLFEQIGSVFADHDYAKLGFSVEWNSCNTADDLDDIAETFFLAAAKEGYVYACNNLAAREADRIVELAKQARVEQQNSGGEQNGEKKQSPNEQQDSIGIQNSANPQACKERQESGRVQDIKNQIDAAIRRYVEFLTISADKYEPYAANRLGLFYRTGEIIGSSGNTVCRDHIDSKLAKEYFLKATVYPDANSAWAYLNLMKYYHQDYDTNIELMNEHMEYIKVLNPEVYDIAMEL